MEGDKQNKITYIIDTKSANSKSGGLSGYTKEETDAKLKEVNYFFYTVVIILLVMVATLIIDSFHINSTTYKEYSEKVNTLNSIKDTNNELLNQNKQNQDLIIRQQNQIIELVNKKLIEK